MSKTPQLITAAMTIAEAIELYPDTADILFEYGLGCAMCSMGQVESLLDGILSHGIPLDEAENIIEELNLVAIASEESAALNKNQ